MKIEDQVCSLELSKRLKELGVKQESLFFWIITGCEKCTEKSELVYAYKADGDKPINCYSAFTAAELANILPPSLSLDDFLFISKTKENLYSCLYDHLTHGLSYYGMICQDKNLANCLANLLIHFLEKKLMELQNDQKTI